MLITQTMQKTVLMITALAQIQATAILRVQTAKIVLPKILLKIVLNPTIKKEIGA